MSRVLSRQDVISLLRKEVERAGGQVAWSKKTGINRPHLNLVLNERRPLTESIVAALNLDTVYIPSLSAPPSNRHDHAISIAKSKRPHDKLAPDHG